MPIAKYPGIGARIFEFPPREAPILTESFTDEEALALEWLECQLQIEILRVLGWKPPEIGFGELDGDLAARVEDR